MKILTILILAFVIAFQSLADEIPEAVKKYVPENYTVCAFVKGNLNWDK